MWSHACTLQTLNIKGLRQAGVIHRKWFRVQTTAPFCFVCQDVLIFYIYNSSNKTSCLWSKQILLRLQHNVFKMKRKNWKKPGTTSKRCYFFSLSSLPLHYERQTDIPSVEINCPGEGVPLLQDKDLTDDAPCVKLTRRRSEGGHSASATSSDYVSHDNPSDSVCIITLLKMTFFSKQKGERQQLLARLVWRAVYDLLAQARLCQTCFC